MIEELRGRFPVKNVQPYGECIIVPAREFQHDWEVSLEGEGHRTFLNAYNGELAFFVRLKKSKPRIFQASILSLVCLPDQD